MGSKPTGLMAGAALAALAGAALCFLAVPAGAAGNGDWPVSGHDAGGQRYSPLAQINKDNVAGLKQAWSYHLKPATDKGPLRLVEAIPIVIGNSMYIASDYGEIIALDASTGAEKWKFELPRGETPSARGVAWWPGRGGRACRDHLRHQSRPPLFAEGLGRHAQPRFRRAGRSQSENARGDADRVGCVLHPPSPPVIYENLVITGAGPGEGPGGSRGGQGPAGDTRAWDARTGKLVWTFHTVPRPGEMGYDTWTPEGAKNRSGVNVWGYMTVDAKRGILYMPLGAPNNDRIGVDRPGNNLFSSSLVAVDANTGKYLWHFQVVHHDIWDYDTQDPPVLADIKHDGKTVPAVLFVNKNALLFILDRVTGKPLFPVEERPVPQSNVPGEKTSPTQPFPVKPEPLSQNTLSRNNLYKASRRTRNIARTWWTTTR